MARRRLTLRDVFGKPAKREELLDAFEQARSALETGTKALEHFAKRASATIAYEALGDEVIMTTLPAFEALVASPQPGGLVEVAARLDAQAEDGDPLVGQHAPPTERSQPRMAVLERLLNPGSLGESQAALLGAVILFVGTGWLLVVLFA